MFALGRLDCLSLSLVTYMPPRGRSNLVVLSLLQCDRVSSFPAQILFHPTLNSFSCFAAIMIVGLLSAATAAGSSNKWPIRAPHADKVPASFDCEMRKAAYDYGR